MFPTRPTERGRRRAFASSSSAERGVQVVLEPVAVARLHPPADAGLVHVHAEERGAVHGRGERLRAAHPAQAAGDHQPTLERPAEVLAGALGEGLVGALQDALRADVDPRAGRHLAVHGEAERIEPAELVPGRPARHQVRVGDQHPRRLLVRPEHPDRLAALDQQGLVVLEPPERRDDPLVALPVAGRLAAAAVDDQLLRPLGDRGVEVVHQHPERRFLVPALAGERRPGGGGDRRGRGEGHGTQSRAALRSRRRPATF